AASQKACRAATTPIPIAAIRAIASHRAANSAPPRRMISGAMSSPPMMPMPWQASAATPAMPGETSSSTKSWTYATWCSGTAAQAPCIEIDETQRINGSTTVTSRAFYDGWGRLIETRKPGPSGQDVVAYANYDEMGHLIAESNSYFVTAYTGG